MWKHIAGGISVQSTITSAIASVMFLSLACSLSLQQGHAGAVIAESAEAVQPLQVGQAAPSFSVQTVDAEPFLFDPTDLDRPALLITFRGGWCPFCNMHLSELRTVVPEIQELGVDVLFLCGDRPELLYRSLAADTQQEIANLDYAIYSDADAQAAIALGIAFKASDMTIERRRSKGQDIADSSMLRHGALPVPAVFVIDRDGEIAFTFVEADYKVRLPADELLKVAREIVQ